MNDGDDLLNNLLARSNGGDAEAFTRLFKIPIDELERVARLLMNQERPDYTLQPTEEFLELERRFPADPQTHGNGESREQFVARMVRLMREILAGYLRAAAAQGVEDAGANVSLPSRERRAADEVLDFWERFNKFGEEWDWDAEVRVAELKFLSSELLSDDEIGQLMGVEPKAVREYTRLAKAWMEDHE